jgi:hypothetical protein
MKLKSINKPTTLEFKNGQRESRGEEMEKREKKKKNIADDKSSHHQCRLLS